ncbi:DUF1294 domain-containing protein [Chryseobacterium sp. SNU WT5]|uniref:DUF1294 domain-containing protein n=1 Tax=Chryseobacterium sp. SNU WT5 TaxID=2594269 RepID=UPI00117D1948|nr:DUF1294 domain-containing protein [Chryseobacterium sp. SNU WT5]QDP84846.1 DUF1294 domain-containing protein [Chryseobacterium sp. SNU WT5]
MNEFSIAFLTTINIGSFIYFGLDKRKAVKHQHLIPETSLLIMTFFGGTIGSILGMLIFKHKTNKKSFIFKMLTVIVIQILIIYLFYNYYQ